MKNKISVYELLGLIKDGKAPKKIKWDNGEWEFKKEFVDYFQDGTYLTIEGFNSFSNAKDFLGDTVEILEEDKPIIDKISINGKDIHKLEELGIYDVIEDIESTLNEIIDKIEKESK